jgi:hypothetical protein
MRNMIWFAITMTSLVVVVGIVVAIVLSDRPTHRSSTHNPTQGPTQGPTQCPTQGPTQCPTQGPTQGPSLFPNLKAFNNRGLFTTCTTTASANPTKWDQGSCGEKEICAAYGCTPECMDDADCEIAPDWPPNNHLSSKCVNIGGNPNKICAIFSDVPKDETGLGKCPDIFTNGKEWEYDGNTTNPEFDYCYPKGSN